MTLHKEEMFKINNAENISKRVGKLDSDFYVLFSTLDGKF